MIEFHVFQCTLPLLAVHFRDYRFRFSLPVVFNNRTNLIVHFGDKMYFPRLQRSRGELRIHEFMIDLTADLAEYVSELSDASVKKRGVFSIALSAGSLIGLLGKLSKSPYTVTVDWDKWYVFWVDEHVLSKTYEVSDYREAKEDFLSKVPIYSRRVSSMKDHLSAAEAAADYQLKLRHKVRARIVNPSDVSDNPNFDLILLDVGPDGHIASLFPDHPALGITEDWVTYITDAPEPPRKRITFTLPVINSASNVALVVTGSSKAEAVHLAIDDIEPNQTILPARMVKPTKGKLGCKLQHAGSRAMRTAKEEVERKKKKEEGRRKKKIGSGGLVAAGHCRLVIEGRKKGLHAMRTAKEEEEERKKKKEEEDMQWWAGGCRSLSKEGRTEVAIGEVEED